MKLRSVALAMALLTGGAAIGATTQHLASASVSSGERPVLIPIEPCRLADTRPALNTIGPRSTPLGPADTLTIDAQQSGVPCSGVIPTDASALSLNITALGATQQSFLTIWASGDRPLAASLNPAPGQPPVPNAVTTELSADQEFRIYNDAGTVNIVVDVNGYYVDHNHDDIYYRRDAIDTALQGLQASLGVKADDVDVYTRDQLYTKAEVDEALAAAVPRVTQFRYGDGLVLQANASFPGLSVSNGVLVGSFRQVGPFTKQRNDTVLRVTWTSHVGASLLPTDVNGALCHWELRIDGQRADPFSSLTSGASMLYEANPEDARQLVPFTVVDYFDGIFAGTHEVDLWSVSSSPNECVENSGGFQRMVTVEELPATYVFQQDQS
ncbi:MAG: hypothetical protein ACE37B_03455 [Ilumatobacter sp.]|uniref:hypothetical protein n=1 Tax=Ilumatobacter sp. TaxID=1967498 RepID=UPI003919B083